MPVIVYASPKGGPGKTTCAIISGTEFAYMGANVTIVDADRTNQSLLKWQEASAYIPERINIVHGANEGNIVSIIEDNDKDDTLVIVDVEGVGSLLQSRAISRADLVIVPMRPTSLDALVGADAINLIHDEERVLRRKIPYAVVFNMTSFTQTKEEKSIREGLIEMGVEILDPPLMQRTMYSSLFKFGGDLRSMPATGQAVNAIKNAEEFTNAIWAKLKEPVA